MRRYQKFLSASPSFIGLGIKDLFTIVVGLNVALIFNWQSELTLIFLAVLVVVGKVLSKYFDLTGYLLSFRKSNKDEIKELWEREHEQFKE